MLEHQSSTLPLVGSPIGSDLENPHFFTPEFKFKPLSLKHVCEM